MENTGFGHRPANKKAAAGGEVAVPMRGDLPCAVKLLNLPPLAAVSIRIKPQLILN
jgi:hypothetical protein